MHLMFYKSYIRFNSFVFIISFCLCQEWFKERKNKKVKLFSLYFDYKYAYFGVTEDLRYNDCLLPKIVVALLFYVHDKHVRSCRDGQLT